mmetsp:Transcript_22951/g.57528  ORF Transcript_22951/g.57528 Transcript_22951/m.57528 type:complete len:201 (-) Transcript_22951:1436-2038(-)
MRAAHRRPELRWGMHRILPPLSRWPSAHLLPPSTDLRQRPHRLTSRLFTSTRPRPCLHVLHHPLTPILRLKRTQRPTFQTHSTFHSRAPIRWHSLHPRRSVVPPSPRAPLSLQVLHTLSLSRFSSIRRMRPTRPAPQPAISSLLLLRIPLTSPVLRSITLALLPRRSLSTTPTARSCLRCRSRTGETVSLFRHCPASCPL